MVQLEPRNNIQFFTQSKQKKTLKICKKDKIQISTDHKKRRFDSINPKQKL